MAIEYTEFGTEQQEQTLRQRIFAWEQDHFGHEINKNAFALLPDGPDKDKGMKDANHAQKVLEDSIKSARAKLDKVRVESPTPEPPVEREPNPPTGKTTVTP